MPRAREGADAPSSHRRGRSQCSAPALDVAHWTRWLAATMTPKRRDSQINSTQKPNAPEHLLRRAGFPPRNGRGSTDLRLREGDSMRRGAGERIAERSI